MENRKKPTNAFARTCITDALFLLMREQPYTDIRVTDLCARAGVARTTYYRNYRSKEEVIRDAIAHIASRYRQRLQSQTHNAHYTDAGSIFLAFDIFQTYSEWILRMYEANLSGLLLDELTRFLLDTPPLHGTALHEQLLRQAYAGALYSVCIHWIRDGMREPAAVVARQFYEDVAGKLFDGAAEDGGDARG